jgi:CBS domain-containing protein
VIDEEGKVIGVLTRRDLLAPRGDEQLTVRALIHRPPVVVSGQQSLRDAADLMVGAKVGRLPVVASDGSRRVVGILSRSDLLAAHERRLDEGRRRAEATLWG